MVVIIFLVLNIRPLFIITTTSSTTNTADLDLDLDLDTEIHTLPTFNRATTMFHNNCIPAILILLLLLSLVRPVLLELLLKTPKDSLRNTPLPAHIPDTNKRDSHGESDITPFTISRPTPRPPTAGVSTSVSSLLLSSRSNLTSASSTYKSTTSTVSSSYSTENQTDKEVFKLVFTVGSDDSYYNAQFQFGANLQQLNTTDKRKSQQIGLRLDIIQPEVWVMNGENYKQCSEIQLSQRSILSQYLKTMKSGSTIPSSVTDLPVFTTNCARRGVYTASSQDKMPEPLGVGDSSIKNGDHYIIPYMNQVQASGEFVTDDLNFNLTSKYNFQMSNFTFVNVNNTNMYVGGLGLASYPKGNGFLSRLVQQDIIKSQSYSLWFSNFTNPETATDSNVSYDALAQLIPGVVNKKYYIGDLYSIGMLPHSGVRYNYTQDSANADLANLILPIINLDNIKVENIDTGQSLSIKSNEDEPLPVLLDSRILYSYLPINVIINLAIQTNAYYSSEANRWLVECDVLTSNGNATIDFVIGEVTVQIPLSEFLVDAVYQGYNLEFENGNKACFLTVLRTDAAGFNSLGLPFLKHIYLVVDNDGKQVALANRNKFLHVDESELLNLDDDKLPPFNFSSMPPPATSAASSSTSSSGSRNVSSSIAYIESGTIPFATPMTYANIGNLTTATSGITLSYSEVTPNASGGQGQTIPLDIPARLSGALIKSGSIFVTGVNTGNVSASSSELRFSQTSTKSKGDAPVVRIGGFHKNCLSVWVSLVCVLFGLGLIMM